jgi:HlyD family secretion protein
MTVKKGLTIAGVVAVGAAVVAANLWLQRETAVTVTTEGIVKRDLEAIVSASGKIQPKRSVQISADTPGRVVDLAVNEGDRVVRDQFLLQIDPRSLRTRVDSGTASLTAAEAAVEQARQSVQTSRVQVEQAQRTLARQQELWSQQLTTREALDKAENDLKAALSSLQEREKQVAAQVARIEQERAGLESARYDLSKVRIVSPIDGIVTRRNIQEGETAMIGTMNNAGTVLLTLADMSVIQAEVEVDETSIPQVSLGQPATVTIDALPDRTFTGRVTEIGNSPIQPPPGTTGARQATNFKVVVVIDGDIPDVRPGFTCTADITTATRTQVTSVPIPAVAVRELLYDDKGQVVKEPRDQRGRRRRSVEPVAAAAELERGRTRKEVEGVFVVRDGARVEFVPIKLGVAGERYFEVLDGLTPGDEVITGPYNSVRGIADGDPVRVDNRENRRSRRTTPDEP